MEYCTMKMKDLQLHGIAWMNYRHDVEQKKPNTNDCTLYELFTQSSKTSRINLLLVVKL